MDEIRLKVIDTRNLGDGRARVYEESMRALGVSEGDPLRIKGGQRIGYAAAALLNESAKSGMIPSYLRDSRDLIRNTVEHRKYPTLITEGDLLLFLIPNISDRLRVRVVSITPKYHVAELTTETVLKFPSESYP